MFALTLETTVETFILAFVTGLAIVAVTSLVRLGQRVRHADRRVGGLARWARRAGRKIDVPYEDEDDE